MCGVRFPEAFETFSGFRKFFPMVSSYCFCSDSRGRELEDTGTHSHMLRSHDDHNEEDMNDDVLVAQVWSSSCPTCTTLRSPDSGPVAPCLRATSTESCRGGCWESASPSPDTSDVNVEFIEVETILNWFKLTRPLTSGPSACEEERRAAVSNHYVPSCDDAGAFTSRQCQQGGQCWCVEPTGREHPGSRQFGDSLICSESPRPPSSCCSLSSLFYLSFFHLFS